VLADAAIVRGRPLNIPKDLAVAGDGTLYVSDLDGEKVEGEEGLVNNIVAIPTRGPARLVAGIQPLRDAHGPLVPQDLVDPFPRVRLRALNFAGLAVGPDGTLFVGDRNNHAVFALDPAGRTRTVAGTGQKGFSGDGGPATSAMIDDPRSLAVNDTTGDLYVAGGDARVRKIDRAGLITTVIGDGVAGDGGDGEPAVHARVRDVRAMAVAGRTGTLYLCDANSVRRIDPAGTVTGVATGPREPQSPVAGSAPVDESTCYGLAVDPRDETVYFASGNHIRRIARTGTVETIAGNGSPGVTQNGKPALGTPMEPSDLAIDGAGNIFFLGGVKAYQQILMLGATPARA
jgi:outer membrane protein assembly factor BamB